MHFHHGRAKLRPAGNGDLLVVQVQCRANGQQRVAVKAPDAFLFCPNLGAKRPIEGGNNFQAARMSAASDQPAPPSRLTGRSPWTASDAIGQPKPRSATPAAAAPTQTAPPSPPGPTITRPVAATAKAAKTRPAPVSSTSASTATTRPRESTNKGFRSIEAMSLRDAASDRATRTSASAVRSTAGSPRNSSNSFWARISRIMSSASAGPTGTGRKTTSATASASTPPTPNGPGSACRRPRPRAAHQHCDWAWKSARSTAAFSTSRFACPKNCASSNPACAS
mgnify:CR=1 FL=1